MTKSPTDLGDTRSKGWLLVALYRWLNVAMVLIFILLNANLQTSRRDAWLVLGLVVAYNAVLTVSGRFLWSHIEKHPLLLFVDVSLCFALTAATGGWRSPYYLYSFSPILTAGVVLGLWRALSMGVVSGLGFWLTVYLDGYTPARIVELNWVDDYVSGFVSYLLVAVLFAYPSTISKTLASSNKDLQETRSSLERANARLEQRNRQLLTLQSVSIAMQASLDFRQVLFSVMNGLRYGMDFDRLLVGLADESGSIITSWVSSDTRTSGGYTRTLEDFLLRLDDYPEMARLVDGRDPVYVPSDLGNALIDTRLASFVAHAPFVLAPLWAGDKLVGVLFAFHASLEAAMSDDDMATLKAFAAHAALGIYNSRLYRHAQELAAMKERDRIAMEIHDGLAQTLSGARLIIGSCQKALKSDPTAAQRQLGLLSKVLSSSYEETRYAIFNLRAPVLAEGGLSLFVKRRLKEFQEYSGVRTSLAVSGCEEKCGEQAQLCLSRVLQEVLANTRKHAHAKSLKVTLEFRGGSVSMKTVDDGDGFEVERAVSRAREGETFGMVALRQRVEATGGILRIESSVGRGTSLEVVVPAGSGGEVEVSETVNS